MSTFSKEEALETLLLIEDDSYNLNRQPQILIDELLSSIKYLISESEIHHSGGICTPS